MNALDQAIDAFTTRNSLDNASNVVAHARKFPWMEETLSEDHAGQVRNAERMIESAGIRPKLKKIARPSWTHEHEWRDD